MAELEEEILRKAEFKPCLWWKYIDDIFLLWEHGEEKLNSFIDNINNMHPTIKFTADWSKTSINFLDVTVSIAEGVIETDLYVKPTGSRQYLLSSSCHSFYFKMGIPYSQALRLNRICSNNAVFDKRCNDLEKHPLGKGYSEKIVRKEILRARAIPRDVLLEKVNNQENQNKTTFNIKYHPVFRDVRKSLEELNVILASDDGHKKVFPDVPMICFKINKNVKAHLVKSQLPDLDEIRRSKPCGGKRPPCHLCGNMKDKCTFKSKHLNEVHKINRKYNCNSKMAVYLIECEICGEQYTGSTKTKSRSRANNYKSTQRKFVNKEAVLKQPLKQKRFHEHYCSDRHNGIQDWVITLINSAATLKELRRKELYWIYKLKTSAPYGLNERDVYEAF